MSSDMKSVPDLETEKHSLHTNNSPVGKSLVLK